MNKCCTDFVAVAISSYSRRKVYKQAAEDLKPDSTHNTKFTSVQKETINNV